MKVLLIGSGGREHALAWKLAHSSNVTDIVVAPGSDGIAQAPKTRCLPDVAASDVERLVDLAARERPDLTVIGPEGPLVAGVADRVRMQQLRVFGPSAAAARLEGSKAFAKALMERAGIPTARARAFDDAAQAVRWLEQQSSPWVVKADGLAAGKGVVVPATIEEAIAAVRRIMVDRQFGEAGARVVLEERLAGEEASLIALADGSRVVPLESAQDHKRLKDGDEGPNTGGMGTYSPAPVVTAERLAAIRRQVLEPTVRAMAETNTPFVGALYAGLMMTADGPQVLEYNVRFGDPETQAILPRLTSDLVEALVAAAEGRLEGLSLAWDPRPCVCVVLAARGYPEKSETGQAITGLDAAARVPDVQLFHAGTRRDGARWVTAGGRVLNVVALGRDYAEAIGRAYAAADQIHFEGKQCRRDIGARAIAPSASRSV
ncbi:MAG: phosphoribosylamine--glycine ligase [Omnitrophica WOR_2 bacterium RIFCSPHIGHO2_02_FULL_68_15]|nr:MAG: phosphoribosylamine--glycine ligase [Omnitrophica WOR_2 bacterium RIFCSPHIGHO2_02_FULL_68_15]